MHDYVENAGKDDLLLLYVLLEVVSHHLDVRPHLLLLALICVAKVVFTVFSM